MSSIESWLPPGLSLAYNGTGRPERVTPSGTTETVIIQVDGRELAPVNRNAQGAGSR